MMMIMVNCNNTNSFSNLLQVAEHVPDTGRSCTMAWNVGVWDLAASDGRSCIHHTSGAAAWRCHRNVVVEYLYSVVHSRCSQFIFLRDCVRADITSRKSPCSLPPTVVFVHHTSLPVRLQTALVSEAHERECVIILWSIRVVVCCTADIDGSSVPGKRITS